MAYEYDFSKNIPLASGFGVGKAVPVDLRTVVNTIAQRDEHVTKGRAFEGLQVYVTDDMKTYIYKGEGTVPTTYKKTTDTSIQEGKTYYTKDENDDYHAVTSTVVDDLSKYYEVDVAEHEGPIWETINSSSKSDGGSIGTITTSDIEGLFD